MKIFQVIVEQEMSAREVKSAFSNNEWARIISHFMSTKGSRKLPSSGAVVSADTVIRSELMAAFKRIGPQMDDNLTPTQWNSRAVIYGANLPGGVITWPAIKSHLEQHKNKPLPQGLDPSLPVEPGRSTRRQDVDRTRETLEDISRWTNFGATLNRAQSIEYFRSMVRAIIEKRRWATENFFRNENSMYVKSWYNLQETHIPAEDQTVEKTVLDRAVYGWLTTADFNLS